MRRILLILFSIVFAVGGFFALRHASGPAVPPRIGVAVAAPAREILVAAEDLPVGAFVRPQDLQWRAWPVDASVSGWIVKGKGAPGDFSGAVVRAPIAKGEPLTPASLVRPGDRGFLAAVLAPGMRAVSVSLTPTGSVSGFVMPGDRVDILVTAPVQGSRSGPVTETVFRDLRVLAVDQRTEGDPKDVSPAKTATLEVTPKEAETLALLGDVGQISLSLRGLAPGSSLDAAATPPVVGATKTWETDALPLNPASAPRSAAAPRAVPGEVRVVRGVAAPEPAPARSVLPLPFVSAAGGLGK